MVFFNPKIKTGRKHTSYSSLTDVPEGQLMQRDIDAHIRFAALVFGDGDSIKKARSLVPLEQLNASEGCAQDDQDKLLPKLVNWFTDKFFTWARPPTCEKCCEIMSSRFMSIDDEGREIKGFACREKSCDNKYEMTRYKDPAILLETRKGCSGEAAICFLVFLRALDYHARIVYDTETYVWNEVWSEKDQRWVHVDPSEGLIDRPLFYEEEWSRQLTYCLAFGEYEVLDVTPRYTTNFRRCVERRGDCHDPTSGLVVKTHSLIKKAPEEEQAGILSRVNKDVQELRSLKNRGVFRDFSAQATGAIEWELVTGFRCSSIRHHRRILTVSKHCSKTSETQDLPEGCIFEFKYNCDQNTYFSSSKDLCKKGWDSLVYRSENLEFTYEPDWRTSYVARYKACPSRRDGLVIWKFDMSEVAGQWKSLAIRIDGKIYPSTSIEISLSSGDESVPLKLNELNSVTPDQLVAGNEILSLRVRLSGGYTDDEVAWQKPQLFRQKRDENNKDWKLLFQVY